MNYTITPPTWHGPQSGGKVIIAIDRQKHWEKVTPFSKRVVAFLESKHRARCNENRLMTRVFVGGLRDPIQEILLEKGIDFTFKNAVFTAELLELAFYASVGGKDPFEVALARRELRLSRAGPSTAPKYCVIQDGVQIFGAPSLKVDKLYRAKSDMQLKILYR